MTSVTVSIVLHNSSRDLADCLVALGHQTRPPDEVVVLDNASHDDGMSIAKAAVPDARLVRSDVNLGFAAGHNRAMAMAPADVHVLLNPDCRLSPAFLERAVAVLNGDPAVGSISGRLLRFRPREHDGGPLEERSDDILDSTGMIALRNRRVLDRGADQPAQNRYQTAGYVFGTSGAAAVYRRSMLEDVAFNGEILDETFFAFREDVDLAWRAQLLGWGCRYVPDMLARHRRRVAPGRRRQLPVDINRRSIANRWRMIAKNETGLGWRRDWLPIVVRDLAIVGYCALREQRSLAALVDVVSDAHRLRRWRRDVMRRRVTPDELLLAWFGRVSQLPLRVVDESHTN